MSALNPRDPKKNDGLFSPAIYWSEKNSKREKTLKELDAEYSRLKKEFAMLYGDERCLDETRFATSFLDNYPSLSCAVNQKLMTKHSELKYSQLVKFKGKGFADRIIKTHDNKKKTREILENNKVLKILSKFSQEPWIVLKEDYKNYYHQKFLQLLTNSPQPKRGSTIAKYLYFMFRHLYAQRYGQIVPKNINEELKKILAIKETGILKYKYELQESGIIAKSGGEFENKKKRLGVVRGAAEIIRNMAMPLPPGVTKKDVITLIPKIITKFNISPKGLQYEEEVFAIIAVAESLQDYQLPSKPSFMSLVLNRPKNDELVVNVYRKIMRLCSNSAELTSFFDSLNFSRYPIDKITEQWSCDINQLPTIDNVHEMNEKLKKAAELTNHLNKDIPEWIPQHVLDNLVAQNNPQDIVATVENIENLRLRHRLLSSYSKKYMPVDTDFITPKIAKLIDKKDPIIYYSSSIDPDVAFLHFVAYLAVTRKVKVCSNRFSLKSLYSFFPEKIVAVLEEYWDETSIPSNNHISLDICKNHNEHSSSILCRMLNPSPETLLTPLSQLPVFGGEDSVVIVEQRREEFPKLFRSIYGKNFWRVSSLRVNNFYCLTIWGNHGPIEIVSNDTSNNPFYQNYLDGVFTYQMTSLLNSSNLNPFQIIMGGSEIYPFILLQLIQLRYLQKKQNLTTKSPSPPIIWLQQNNMFDLALKSCGIKSPDNLKKRLKIKVVDVQEITGISGLALLFKQILTPIPPGSIVVFPQFHLAIKEEYIPEEAKNLSDEDYYLHLWEKARSQIIELENKAPEMIQRELDLYLEGIDNVSQKEYNSLKKQAELKFRLKKEKLIASLDAKIKAAVISRSYKLSKLTPAMFEGQYNNQTKTRLFQFFQMLADISRNSHAFILLGIDSKQFFKVPITKFIPNLNSVLPSYPVYEKLSQIPSDLNDRYHFLTEKLFLDIFQLPTYQLDPLSPFTLMHLSEHQGTVVSYIRKNESWNGEILQMTPFYTYLSSFGDD